MLSKTITQPLHCPGFVTYDNEAHTAYINSENSEENSKRRHEMCLFCGMMCLGIGAYGTRDRSEAWFLNKHGRQEEDTQKITDEYRSKVVSFADVERDYKKQNRKFYSGRFSSLFFHLLTILLLFNTYTIGVFSDGDNVFILMLILLAIYWVYWFILICTTAIFHGFWFESAEKKIEKKTNGRIKLLWVGQNDWHDDETDEGIVDKVLGRLSFKICAITAFLVLNSLYYWKTTIPFLNIFAR